MSVITLTTEWQEYDFYNGVLKGKLISACPGATIVDIASSIPSFNLQHAAFVVRNSFKHFPKGSIHIISVHSEYHTQQPHLLVQSQGHYFIGSDNGIFHLILNAKPEKIIRISRDKNIEQIDDTSVFANTAAILHKGGKPEDAGEAINEIIEKVPLRATIEENSISGSIIFIDSYSNAISNITRDVFERVFKNKTFNIAIRSNTNVINRISTSYKSEGVSDLIAIFNSLDLIEVGINGANASELLSIEIGDIIRIDHPEITKKQGMLF